MTNHVVSVGLGFALAVLGFLLWTLTDGVATPVVYPSKVGLVLLVLGALEVLVSAGALALRSTRHVDEPL